MVPHHPLCHDTTASPFSQESTCINYDQYQNREVIDNMTKTSEANVNPFVSYDLPRQFSLLDENATNCKNNIEALSELHCDFIESSILMEEDTVAPQCQNLLQLKSPHTDALTESHQVLRENIVNKKSTSPPRLRFGITNSYAPPGSGNDTLQNLDNVEGTYRDSPINIASNWSELTDGLRVRRLEREESIRSTESTASSKRRCLTDSSRSLSSQSLSQESTNQAMSEDLLHNSCRLFPTSLAVIQSALNFDPFSIRLAKPTECVNRALCSNIEPFIVSETTESPEILDSNSTQDTSSQPCSNPRSIKSETYNYAINIALLHGASADVIHLLARTAPDILLLPDGPGMCGSLSIFLAQARTKHSSPENALIVRALLRSSRQCASILDRYRNSPLHYGVLAARQLPLHTLALLYAAYPDALQQRNFNGKSPIELAVCRSSLVPLEVVDLLSKLSYSRMEAMSVEYMNQMVDSLDETLRLENCSDEEICDDDNDSFHQYL